MSAVIPMVFLFQKKYRDSKTAMFWIAACATVGMSLNRVNVAGLATLSSHGIRLLSGLDGMGGYSRGPLRGGIGLPLCGRSTFNCSRE